VSLREPARVLAGGSVVAFTGAGISSESGIPTFRDPGGLWSRYDAARFGTWNGLVREAMVRPDDLAGFLAAFRGALAAARPNAAHLALAELERAGLLDGVVTQNVDGLHQEAGSQRVVEVHGSVRRQLCLVCGCARRIPIEEFLDGLDRAVRGLRSAFVPGLASLLPRCLDCGGPARPGIVAFGEPLLQFDEAEGLVRSCRAMLVVGTSGEVEPAASLPRLARDQGIPVVHVGLESLVESDVDVRGQAAVVVPELVRRALRGHGG
jgi:NAD-dependent deacetylase